LDEAKQILRRAFDAGMDSVFLRVIQNNAAFLEGDMVTVKRNLEWAKGRAGSDSLLSGRAAMAIYYGKLRESVDSFNRRWKKPRPAQPKACGELPESGSQRGSSGR